MGRKKGQKAIDYIREKVEESKDYCNDEKALESVNAILNVLNKDDYVFFRLNPEATEVVFRLTGFTTMEAREVYNELKSPKEYIKYRVFQLSKVFKKVVTLNGRFTRKKNRIAKDEQNIQESEDFSR